MSPLESNPLASWSLAVDLTNSLRSAETGLRGLRNRSFLARVWDEITGRGPQAWCAVGQDLLTHQKAVLQVVDRLTHEQLRSQHCLKKVLGNLPGVNRELDRLGAVDRELQQRLKDLESFVQKDLDRLEARVLRGEIFDQLKEGYRAGRFFAGAGPILGGALFLASVEWLVAEVAPDEAGPRLCSARSVVQDVLGGRPLSTEQAFLNLASAVGAEELNRVAYLVEVPRGPFSTVAYRLLERRAADLPLGREEARNALTLARTLHDPGEALASHLLRPSRMAEELASELVPMGLKVST